MTDCNVLRLRDSQDIYHHDKQSQLYLKMIGVVYAMNHQQTHVITQ